MTHRPPTAADIGKQVEVNFHGWIKATLETIEHSRNNVGTITTSCRCTLDPAGSILADIELVRVPYSCPDPIAELSEAADLLAERGVDYAASMLLECLRILQMNNGAEPAVVATYLRIDT